jgi:hypothetical protein
MPRCCKSKTYFATLSRKALSKALPTQVPATPPNERKSVATSDIATISGLLQHFSGVETGSKFSSGPLCVPLFAKCAIWLLLLNALLCYYMTRQPMIPMLSFHTLNDPTIGISYVYWIIPQAYRIYRCSTLPDSIPRYRYLFYPKGKRWLGMVIN